MSLHRSAQLDGPLVDVGEEAGVHPVHDDIRTGADHRVSAERGAVAAGSHTGSDFFIHQDSANRQAAAQTLGQRDDVGLEVVVLAAQDNLAN